MANQNNPDQTKTKLPWKEVMEKGIGDCGDFSGYGDFTYKTSENSDQPPENRPRDGKYQV